MSISRRSPGWRHRWNGRWARYRSSLWRHGTASRPEADRDSVKPPGAASSDRARLRRASQPPSISISMRQRLSPSSRSSSMRSVRIGGHSATRPSSARSIAHCSGDASSSTHTPSMGLMARRPRLRNAPPSIEERLERSDHRAARFLAEDHLANAIKDRINR